jgi:hypothetical protein
VLLLRSTLATGKGNKGGSGKQNGSHTSLVLRPGCNDVFPDRGLELLSVLFGMAFISFGSAMN